MLPRLGAAMLATLAAISVLPPRPESAAAACMLAVACVFLFTVAATRDTLVLRAGPAAGLPA